VNVAIYFIAIKSIKKVIPVCWLH